jgi:peptidoglycan/xylan/chitin deacetylase (PgdA/CDA1 family)
MTETEAMTRTRICFTIDTEGDSADNPNTSYLGIHLAVPKLAELFNRLGVKATFFIQDDEICRLGSQFTDLWLSLQKQGHEIGYHAHGIIREPLERKEAIISSGIRRLREAGIDIVSYRGGRFHLNGGLLKVLEKNGIKYDSSVVPGLRETFPDGTERCDHVGAPHRPYFPSYEDHKEAGTSSILELPINRYPYYFDYFYQSRKDGLIIALVHSWEGLSFKIRDAVRRKKYGKARRFVYESLKKIFSLDFLVNKAYFPQLESFLNYARQKEDVSFITIREAGETWHLEESK